MIKTFLSFFSSRDMGVQWLNHRIERFQINWTMWNKWLFRLLMLVLFAGLIIYVVAAAKVMPFPHVFKGWAGGHFIYSAWMLSKGQNFFVDPVKEPIVTGCYTPGFPILIAPLVLFFGPKMWVGRVVAIAGLVFIWLLIYTAAQRQAGKRQYGLIAVGFLMATYGVMDSHFDNIHPDSWFIAWGLLSLVLVESSLRNRSWLIPLAALAAAFSYFTKQTGLSFAIGATIFLTLRRPRFALYYTAGLGVLLVVGYLIGQYLTDGMFYYQTTGAATAQPIRWPLIFLILRFVFTTFIFAIIVTFFLLLDRPSSLSLTSPYAISLPILFAFHLYASARVGGNVSSNLFPFLAAGSIVFTSGLASIRDSMAETSPKLTFLLLAMILTQNVMTVSKLPQMPTPEHYVVAAQIDKLVQETPGEVLLLHRISFSYLNGRKVYDNLGGMFDHPKWTDYDRLEKQLRTRYFTRILVPKVAVDIWFFNKPFYQVLLENYELEMTIGYVSWFQTTPMLVFHRK